MQQEINCPKCGAQNLSGAQYCGSCGARLVTETPRQTVACSKCGSQNPTAQQFCGACGTKLAAVVPQDVGKTVDSLLSHSQVQTKPTWGLAWGLWWRMLLLTLLVGLIIELIWILIVLNSGTPFGS